MKLKVSWASSRNRRKENQDNLSIGEQAAFPEGIEERHISGQVLMDIREDNEVLFAVADGLGGCTNGKYAAARCLESLRESFYSFYIPPLKPKQRNRRLSVNRCIPVQRASPRCQCCGR